MSAALPSPSISADFPGCDLRNRGHRRGRGPDQFPQSDVERRYDGATCGATCTLRQAINAANTQGNGDITFDSTLNGATLTLTGILPKIEGAIDITGPSSGFTIDGKSTYQGFWVDGGSSLSIANLTIQNASTATVASGGFARATAAPSLTPAL